MAPSGRSATDMSTTLRGASTRLLLGGALVLVAGVTLLAISRHPVVAWTLVGLAVVDLVLALVVRGLSDRTSAHTPASSQERR